MLDAKIRNLKQQGKQNVEHKPCITTPDLHKLKVHPVISPSTPLGLLRNVWFHTTLYWCRRGREGQRNLTASSLSFLWMKIIDHMRPWPTTSRQRIIQVELATPKVLRRKAGCIKHPTTQVMASTLYSCTYLSSTRCAQHSTSFQSESGLQTTRFGTKIARLA